MVVHALPDGEPMSNGIISLRGYQRGGPIQLGGGLAALLSRKFGKAASRLAPLFFGKRSETGYVPGVSESIYNAVVPDYNMANTGQLMDAMRRIYHGEPGLPPEPDWEKQDMNYELGRGGIETINFDPLREESLIESVKSQYGGRENPDPGYRIIGMGGRYMRPEPGEDAWRTYLGLDQEYGTFRESEFRPTIGSGEDIRYRDFANPERVIDTLASRPPYSSAAERSEWREMTDEERRRRTLEGLERMISSGKPGLSSLHPWGHREVEGGPFITSDYSAWYPEGGVPYESGDVMGDYTLSAGEDEGGPYISYYDKWDVAPKVGQISKAGKPFDIYGRMYYDPETYEYRGSNE